MIKARELRTGNRVMCNDRIVRVISVHKAGIVFLSAFGHTDVKNIYPVKLSREWLLDYGFIDTHDGIYKHKGLTEVFHTLNEFFFRYDGKFIASCKHLHELQNIYFALYKVEIRVDKSAVLSSFAER